MTNTAPWAKNYIGIPFVSGGRDRSGLDCYGLLRLVLSEQFGKELPALSSEYSSADDFIETEKVLSAHRPLLAGRQVESPEPGDICVIKYMGFPSHVGIYVGDGLVLHTLRATWSVLQRCGDPHLKGRIEGWYRVN